MRLENPETATGAVASLVSDSTGHVRIHRDYGRLGSTRSVDSGTGDRASEVPVERNETLIRIPEPARHTAFRCALTEHGHPESIPARDDPG